MAIQIQAVEETERYLMPENNMFGKYFAFIGLLRVAYLAGDILHTVGIVGFLAGSAELPKINLRVGGEKEKSMKASPYQRTRPPPSTALVTILTLFVPCTHHT